MKDTNLECKDPFFEARNILNGLIDALRKPQLLHAEHGDIEKLIKEM